MTPRSGFENMMSTFEERMKVLIELAGGPSELARKAQVSRRVIDKYKSGESDPSRERLISLAASGGVSVQWLATGDDLEGPSEAEFIGIPRYDATLAAGSGAFNDRAKLIDHIPFTREFMANKLGRSTAEGLVVLEARGDSMEPTIGGGDLVLVDQKSKEIADGIMAFVLDDTAFVKRVRTMPGSIEVISDNHMYPPYKLEQDRLDDLHVIGRVRWIGKTVSG